MTYVFDIDGTICTKLCELKGQDYNDSLPLRERIDKVNALYDEGHKIIYMTARGMGRYENNRSLAEAEFWAFTNNQLKEWGCKYHELFLGKPAADIYVDDKGMNDENFFTN